LTQLASFRLRGSQTGTVAHFWHGPFFVDGDGPGACTVIDPTTETTPSKHLTKKPPAACRRMVAPMPAGGLALFVPSITPRQKRAFDSLPKTLS